MEKWAMPANGTKTLGMKLRQQALLLRQSVCTATHVGLREEGEASRLDTMCTKTVREQKDPKNHEDANLSGRAKIGRDQTWTEQGTGFPSDRSSNASVEVPAKSLEPVRVRRLSISRRTTPRTEGRGRVLILPIRARL